MCERSNGAGTMGHQRARPCNSAEIPHCCLIIVWCPLQADRQIWWQKSEARLSRWFLNKTLFRVLSWDMILWNKRNIMVSVKFCALPVSFSNFLSSCSRFLAVFSFNNVSKFIDPGFAIVCFCQFLQLADSSDHGSGFCNTAKIFKWVSCVRLNLREKSSDLVVAVKILRFVGEVNLNGK